MRRCLWRRCSLAVRRNSGAVLIDFTTYIHVSASLAIDILVQMEVLLTYYNLLEANNDHQHKVTLTLADFDIDLTKSISITAVPHGLPPR